MSNLKVNKLIPTGEWPAAEYIEDESGTKSLISVTQNWVGIGTASSNPGQRLSVKALAPAADSVIDAITIQQAGGGGGRIVRSGQGFGGSGFLYLVSPGGARHTTLEGDGDNWVSYGKTAGNFGIGTAEPKSKLDVAGTITCPNINITDCQPISAAPDSSRLRHLKIDPVTGTVYQE